MAVGTYASVDLPAPRPGFGARAPAEGRRDGGDLERRATRRRWALAKMDEMARERQRCREKFKVARQVSECEAQYSRRYHEYNEIYLDASRNQHD